MYFTHDTDFALVTAAALVNTARNGDERLPDVAALTVFLDEHQMTGRRDGTAAELDQVQQLRGEIRSIWVAPDDDAAVTIVNAMLADANARPWLTRHGEWDWHLHVTASDDPLVRRLAAEAAMAVVDVIRRGDLDRLKSCAADDCDAVLIDLSRNRSRRYCDTGNCGNRANVAAYRARKAGQE